MNGHTTKFGHVLKKSNKFDEISKKKGIEGESSFLAYYYEEKIVNLKKNNFAKTVFTKWTNLSRGSWLSSQMAKVTPISMENSLI